CPKPPPVVEISAYGQRFGVATSRCNSNPLWMPKIRRRSRHLANRISASFSHVLGGDSGFGILLMIAALGAMAMANSALSPVYHDIFHHKLPWTPIAKLDSLH